jgi:DNA repair exonuclease SbcCD ATPase subunit
MIIKEIYIKNYGPFYGEHNFKIDDRGLVLVIGRNTDELKMESNGSGKSSIFDALDWALWGEVPRKDHIDSIVNDKALLNKEPCYVKVVLFDENKNNIFIYRERYKGKTSLNVELNGNISSFLDIKETQKHLENLLGLDRDVFHSSILFAQNDLSHYADSSDARRMEILTKILQLDKIDSLCEFVKGKLNDFKVKENRLVYEIDLLNKEIIGIDFLNYDEKIKDWESCREIELNRLYGLRTSYGEKDAYSYDIAAYLEKINEKNCIIDAYKSKIISPNDRSDCCNLSNIILSLKEHLDIIKNFMHEGEIKLKNLDKDCLDLQNRMDSLLPVCPFCEQPISKDYLKDKLILLTTERSKVVIDLDKIKSDASYLAEESRIATIEHEKLLKEVNDHNDNINNLIREASLDRDKLLRQKEEIDQNAAAVASLDELIRNKKSELNPYLQQQKTEEIRKDKVKRDIDSLNISVNAIYKIIPFYEFWLKSFSAKGLKSYILDSKIGEVNFAINYWANLLTGGTIGIELVTQKRNRNKELVNSPDIKISKWDGDRLIIRNYNSWSGGEKQRISIAIDLGLSFLIANRSLYKYNILIFDEIFKHLDSGGKSAVMDMLNVLISDKNTIFVIEHDDSFKDLFENSVLVQKNNGSSIILEMRNEDAKETNKRNNKIPASTNKKRIPIRKPISGY